ncbi:MAG: O-antigen ligase family protein [Clostridium sp.]
MEKLIYWLVCIYIILLPLINDSMKIIGYIPEVILLGLIAIYFVSMIIVKDTSKTFWINIKDFFTSFLGMTMMILVTLMMVSTFYSVEKNLALSESFRFGTYMCLVFIIKYEFNSERKIDGLIRSFLFVTSMLVLMGIIQYFTGFGLNQKFILAEGNRITTTMQNPNGYGAYLILSLFPIIMLSFKEKNKLYKKLYIVLSILIITNILCTYSRNAFVGLIIGFIALAIMYNYKFIYGIAGIGILAIFNMKLIYRLVDIKELPKDPRIKLWKTAIKMIKENPIKGVGNGNYVARYDEYVKKYPECAYPDYHRFSSHNSYLKVQSELGVFGIAFFVLMLTASLKSIFKAYRTANNVKYKMFFLGVFASAIAFLAMNMLDNLFFAPQTTTFFWIFVALAEAIGIQAQSLN